MSAQRDVNRIVRSWLRADDHESADAILGLVLSRLDTTPQRRSWWPARRIAFMDRYAKLAAAVAAVAVVAVLGFSLLGGGVGPPATSAPPSAVTPTASAPPTAPAVAPTAMPLPSAAALVPGDYYASLAPVRITFTVFEPGWLKNVAPDTIWSSSSETRFGFGIVSNLLADPCVPGVELDPPVGPTVDDLASALASLPGVEAATTSDVDLGGYSGKLVEFTIPDTTEPCDGMWGREDLGARIRYWILDVQGNRLVTHAVERPGNPTLAARLQKMIDSIRIEVP